MKYYYDECESLWKVDFLLSLDHLEINPKKIEELERLRKSREKQSEMFIIIDSRVYFTSYYEIRGVDYIYLDVNDFVLLEYGKDDVYYVFQYKSNGCRSTMRIPGRAIVNLDYLTTLPENTERIVSYVESSIDLLCPRYMSSEAEREICKNRIIESLTPSARLVYEVYS